MSEVALLVFDWDGTLSDSLERIVTCLQIAADEVGLPVPSEAEGRAIVGLGLPEALARLFPGAAEERLAALQESYARHYVRLDAEPPPFFDTVLETLEALRADGYRLAVATGKSRRGLDRVLARLDMDGFFHATRCADETRSKPHPRMLQELLALFELPPERALMVGDTTFDMEMARRAGMPRLGVSWGAHPAEQLLPWRPIGILERFAELRDLLGGGELRAPARPSGAKAPPPESKAGR